MRSELVFCAKRHVRNRYLLVRAAAQAIRKAHRPHTRIADTTNEVLEWFGRGNPFATPVTNMQVFSGKTRFEDVLKRIPGQVARSMDPRLMRRRD